MVVSSAVRVVPVGTGVAFPASAVMDPEPREREKYPVRIRVLVYDTNVDIRRAIGDFVDRQADLETCELAGAPEPLLLGTARCKPDVVVLGLSSAEGDGLELISRIHGRHPSARVLALSPNDRHAGGLQARAAGALGYVGKYAAAADLLSGIRVVAAGLRYGIPDANAAPRASRGPNDEDATLARSPRRNPHVSSR
jgi:DNA-binding NarL/FixJ family response regulator